MEKEKHWSRLAGDFERRLRYVAGERNIETIRAILAEQKLSGRILELGCGNGTYSDVLARTAERLHVTDLSDEMLAFCRERLKSLGNAVVEKQDCFALSFPDASFDATVMVNLLHVIPQPEKAVAESRRILKPGGTLVVISFTTDGMGFLAKAALVYRYRRAFGKRPAAARKLTVDKTRAMLEGTGFAVGEARLFGSGSKAVFARASAT